METEFTRQFSNATVCNFFFYLSIAILVVGSLPLLFKGLPGLIAAIASGKSNMIIAHLLIVTVQSGMLALAVFVYLFISVICDRCLLDKDSAKVSL